MPHITVTTIVFSLIVVAIVLQWRNDKPFVTVAAAEDGIVIGGQWSGGWGKIGTFEWRDDIYPIFKPAMTIYLYSVQVINRRNVKVQGEWSRLLLPLWGVVSPHRLGVDHSLCLLHTTLMT